MIKNTEQRDIVAHRTTDKRVDPAVGAPRFTNDFWNANNMLKIKICRDQSHMAQSIINDSNRCIEEVNEDTKCWQREVDYHLRSRAHEIDFLTNELCKQRQTAVMEEEALSHYRNRIGQAMDQMKNAMRVNHECMKFRSSRLGVDLCTDDVEIQLIQELKALKGCEVMIKKTLEDTTSQLLRLRGALFILDKDIEQKHTAMLIDRQNLNLRESMPNLRRGGELKQLKCGDNDLSEWQRKTTKNIETNAKELVSAGELRGYIDLLLKQICEDLQNQTERTNDAFRRRIRETREIKHLLEDKHAEMGDEILTLSHNIRRLEQEIADRERSLTLCQTRLSNRAMRSSMELTCDMPQKALQAEFKQLQCNLAKLNQKLSESKAMLRYLSHTKLMQEEEINVKTNTLKIDEVDCMSMREVLYYSTF